MLKYPNNLNEGQTDYVSFTHREYKNNSKGGGVAAPGTGERIVLYMPNSTPVANYGNSWGNSGQTFDGPIGLLKKKMAQGLGDSVNELGNTVGNLGDGVEGNAFESIRQLAKDAGRSAGDMVGDMIDNRGGLVKQLGMNAVGGMLVGSGNNLLALTQGKIYNPNVELLYQGPQLRTFSFQFNFVPKNSNESSVISQIIKEFKMWSAPGDPGEEGYLSVPHVWDIRYGGKVDGKMNKFKPCALVNVSVQDNAGSDLHSTFEDGTPTLTSVSLSFNEVDILTRKDHEDGGERGF
jgi:hypothetical protein